MRQKRDPDMSVAGAVLDCALGGAERRGGLLAQADRLGGPGRPQRDRRGRLVDVEPAPTEYTRLCQSTRNRNVRVRVQLIGHL